MSYKNNIYIYLDDLRTPSGKDFPADTKILVCNSYKMAISVIESLGNKEYINLSVDLDHDLGSKKTGYDFCKYLIEQGWVGKFHCHTANPVGAANMKQLLIHYGWEEF